MLNDGIPYKKLTVATATAPLSLLVRTPPEIPSGGTGEPPIQAL